LRTAQGRSGMGVPAARIAPVNAIAIIKGPRGEAILAGIQTPSPFIRPIVNPSSAAEGRKAASDRTQNF